MVEIQCYRNEAVTELRPVLDAWAHSNYREYPYFYVFQKENDYNKIFEIDPTAFVLFAESNEKKIGLLQANALDSSFLKDARYTPYLAMDQIQEKGFDPEKTLYITSFLTTKEERLNREMLSKLFDRAVEIAKEMGKKQICYMEIVQDFSHPLTPNPYIPIEPWSELNVLFRTTGIQIEMKWPTLQPDGQVKEEAHILEIFITDIA